MKKSKKLKLVLIILICILTILIGFGGIYVKKNNSYKNILPNYKYASDLKGITTLEFEISNEVNTIYYDKDGKEVNWGEITEENEKDYTKKEISVNAEENLTSTNYKKCLKIMKERLNFLQADQYELSLDEESGKIVLAFEDDYPDDIVSILSMKGDFQLVDSTTEDIILNYNDFKKVEPSYVTTEEGYNVYISLKLNDSGIEKINNIEKYKTSSDEKSGEEIVNNFKVMFDKDKIAEVSYNDITLNGKDLKIITHKELRSDSEINSALNTNSVISKLATIGNMPVFYEIVAEEYVKSNAINNISIFVKIIGLILIVIFIVLILKYRVNGILAILSYITNIALYLILIRLTDVKISLNAFAGIVGLIILNTIMVVYILENIKNKDKNFGENIKNAYVKSIDYLVIMAIIFVVFTFSKMMVISSMGLIVFWGWAVIVLGNLMFTVPMLNLTNKN